jgi:hypothetical protein
MRGQHRPLEPAEGLALATFGRRAQRLADELMTLAALPEAVRMQPDAYSWEEIRHVADTLRGMALRCALEVGDQELLTEVTGRTWRKAHPTGDRARDTDPARGDRAQPGRDGGGPVP